MAPEAIHLSSKPKTQPIFKFSEASGREFTYDLMESLGRETEYRFTVEATALSGAELDPPYTFTFTTGIEPRPDAELPPQIGLSPADRAVGVELEPTLSFFFSKAMEPATVEAALHLDPVGQCSTLTWNSDGTKLDCAITDALPPATTVSVTLDASASATDGATLDEPFTSTFTTRSRPTLVSTVPADGEVVAGVDGRVVLEFAPNNSMDAASLKTAFRYVSPAGHPVMDANCFFEKCTITTSKPFSEREKIAWELSTEATDSTGIAIGETASGTFSTGHLTTITLDADPALDGSVTEAGTVDASGQKLSVGRNAGKAIRSLLSFDLAKLPSNLLAFSTATLSLNHELTSGTTSGLGFLLVYSVDYGTSLTASAFDAPINTYESCNLLWQCSPLAFDAGLSASAGQQWTSPVSDLVQRDLGEKVARSQMRIAFKSDTTATSNASETFTSANAAANRPSLQIEYWEP